MMNGSSSNRNHHTMVSLNSKDDFFKNPFFSSSWEDFDKESSQFMKQSTDFWNSVEAEMKSFEATCAAMEADMENKMLPLRPDVPSWALPNNQKQNWPSVKNQKSASGPGFSSERIIETDTIWQLEISLDGYDADTVKLSVAGNVVSVKASKQHEVVYNSIHSSSSQSVVRKFTLPAGCDPDQITSKLSLDNVLSVTCPRKMMLSGPSSKALRYR